MTIDIRAPLFDLFHTHDVSAIIACVTELIAQRAQESALRPELCEKIYAAHLKSYATALHEATQDFLRDTK